MREAQIGFYRVASTGEFELDAKNNPTLIGVFLKLQ
jgi:hypothetical protein